MPEEARRPPSRSARGDVVGGRAASAFAASVGPTTTNRTRGAQRRAARPRPRRPRGSPSPTPAGRRRRRRRRRVRRPSDAAQLARRAPGRRRSGSKRLRSMPLPSSVSLRSGRRAGAASSMSSGFCSSSASEHGRGDALERVDERPLRPAGPRAARTGRAPCSRPPGRAADARREPAVEAGLRVVGVHDVGRAGRRNSVRSSTQRRRVVVRRHRAGRVAQRHVADAPAPRARVDVAARRRRADHLVAGRGERARAADRAAARG